jgi:hypothetical protein
VLSRDLFGKSCTHRNYVDVERGREGKANMKTLRLILTWLHDRIHDVRFQRAKVRASKGSRWNRLPRAERRRVAVRSGVSASIADTWAKIRYRDLPEGWRERVLENCR